MINAKSRQYLLSKYTRPYDNADGPRYADLSIAPRKRFAGRVIRVVSYNIRLSQKIDQAIALIEENENLKSADVFCLQEMNHDAVCRISRQLQLNYIYYPAASHQVYKRDIGNAILSRFNMVDDKKIILPVPGSPTSRRIAVIAQLECGQRRVQVFCVHKEVFLKPSNRQKQVETILKAMPEGQEHAVVAGDFNTFYKKSLVTILDSFSRAGFRLATMDVDWTYKHWYLLNKKSRLDHIFVKGFDTFQSGKVHDHGPSDHLPIWAVLKFI